MRDPIDRAASCLFYFYRDAMKDVSEMTEEDFRKMLLEDTLCNNAAAGLLVSSLPGTNSRMVNKASLNASLSTTLAASALSNLERCVIVNHLDVFHGKVWATWPQFFSPPGFPGCLLEK